MHFVEPFLVYFCWRLILPAEHQTILLNFRSLFGDNGEAWYGVDDDDDAACLLYDHKRMCHECDAQIHRLDVDELNVLWSDNWMVGIFLMYFASYTSASQQFIRSLVLFCNFLHKAIDSSWVCNLHSCQSHTNETRWKRYIERMNEKWATGTQCTESSIPKKDVSIRLAFRIFNRCASNSISANRYQVAAKESTWHELQLLT